MTNTGKNIMWAVLAVVVIGIGSYFLMGNRPTNSTSYDTQTSPSQTAKVGRVVFSVTDAAASMGAVSEVTMKVNGIAVHNNTDGWVVVSTTPRTYNLLTLNSQKRIELLADANIKAGTYDKVRLMVDSITIKTKAGVTKTANIPSHQLELNTKLIVKEDKTASIKFDFLADKSLHIASNGAFIFTPVVKTEARSESDVNVDTNSNIVSTSGGHVDKDDTEGMDVDGNVKENFELDTSKKLDIDANDVIRIGGKTSSDDNSREVNTNTNTNLNVRGSSDNSATEGNLNLNLGGTGTIKY